MEPRCKYFTVSTIVLLSLVLCCRCIVFGAQSMQADVEKVEVKQYVEQTFHNIPENGKKESLTKTSSAASSQEIDTPPTKHPTLNTENGRESTNQILHTQSKNVDQEATKTGSSVNKEEKKNILPSDKKTDINENSNHRNGQSILNEEISRPCFPSEKPEVTSGTSSQPGTEKLPLAAANSAEEPPPPAVATGNGEQHGDSSNNLQDTTKDASTDTLDLQVESEQQVDKKEAKEEKIVTEQAEKVEPTEPAAELPVPPPEKPPAPPSGSNDTQASSPAAPAGDVKVDSGLEDVKFGTEPSGVHLDEDREEDMPSFEEWKKKMLHEQEKEKKNKQITQPIQASVITPNQAAKNRVNHAAMTCGAKVLSVNPESQFGSYILSENRDQYMINPCKAKKWFVIELCEPVQVKRLEIANFELFSSTPASFIMQISDRYPTKEWRTVGTFHARDERSIQIFLLSDEQMYAKYIRIEIMSHFGDEHYCPLSIVRVFGTSEEEEYEQSEQGQLDNTPDDSSAGVTDSDKDKPTNLFTSATDTVLSLVKTVLHSKDEEQNATDASAAGDAASLAPADKTTDIPNATTKDQLAGCPSQDSGGDKQVNIDTSSGARETKPQPPKPDINSGTAQDTDSAPAETTELPLVVKIKDGQDEDTTSLPAGGAADLVTLIDSPSKLEGGESLHTLLSRCNFCHKRGQVTPCYFDKSSTCGYFKTLTFVYPTSCVVKMKKKILGKIPTIPSKPAAEPSVKVNKSSEIKKNTVSEQDSGTRPRVSEVTKDLIPPPTVDVEKRKTSYTTVAGTQTVSSSSSATSPSISIKSDVTAPSASTPTATTSQIKPAPTQKLPDISTDQKQPATKPQEADVEAAENRAIENEPSLPPLESSQQTVTLDVTATEKTQPLPSCKTPQDGTGVGCTEPAVIQIRPTETTSDPASTVQPTLSPSMGEPAADKNSHKMPTPVPSNTEKQTVEATKDMTASGESTKVAAKDKTANGASSNNGGGENKKIYADNTTKVESDQQPNLGLEAEEAPVKTSGGKQSAFMRLNNRIKTLEQNLSLSSRYLEELSQRYRKKMEEMYASLDFAIDQLAETAKSAEERDQKQQENISILQTQIHNLTGVVARLSDEMSSLQHQMIERHLFLMLAEVLIFMVIMATCITRNSERPPPTKTELMELRELIKNMPETPHLKRHRRQRSDETLRPRSSSSVTLSEKWALDDINIRHSGSDSNLTIIPPTIPIYIDSNSSITDLPKKKKVPTATLR